VATAVQSHSLTLVLPRDSRHEPDWRYLKDENEEVEELWKEETKLGFAALERVFPDVRAILVGTSLWLKGKHTIYTPAHPRHSNQDLLLGLAWTDGKGQLQLGTPLPLTNKRLNMTRPFPLGFVGRLQATAKVMLPDDSVADAAVLRCYAMVADDGEPLPRLRVDEPWLYEPLDMFFRRNIRLKDKQVVVNCEDIVEVMWLEHRCDIDECVRAAMSNATVPLHGSKLTQPGTLFAVGRVLTVLADDGDEEESGDEG